MPLMSIQQGKVSTIPTMEAITGIYNTGLFLKR